MKLFIAALALVSVSIGFASNSQASEKKSVSNSQCKAALLQQEKANYGQQIVALDDSTQSADYSVRLSEIRKAHETEVYSIKTAEAPCASLTPEQLAQLQ